MGWARWAIALTALGCASEQDETQTPVVATCGSAEHELPDGSCIRPGVPPDGCASGFVHDGEYGCDPILPEAPCAPGWLAVPGDAECRPVMPCGAGTWGDIAVDATTVYVQQSYAGGDSDGSADKPWTTIRDAFTAAAPGALIAIAAGNYVGDVVLAGKAVRLAGICPERVTIVGSGAQPAALFVQASGTQVSGIALSGATMGLIVTDATDVSAERIWVHDNGYRGIDVEDTLGPASFSLRDALVENNHDVGVFVSGAAATLERSVVRGTLPEQDSQTHGEGVQAQTGPVTSVRAALTVFNSVVEANHFGGVVMLGGDATVEASVIRNTLAQPSDGRGGRGVWIQSDVTLPIVSNLRLVTSLVANSRDVGVLAHGTHATIERAVVRDTVAGAGSWGQAVQIQIDALVGTEASGIVRESLIERSDGAGIFFARAPGAMERVAVRDAHVVGLYLKGTSGTIDRSLVQRTSPVVDRQPFGRGIGVELWCTADCEPATRGHGTVANSVVEDGFDVGLLVAAMDATVDNVRVSRTLPRPDGSFGDGVAVVGGDGTPASAALARMHIESSSRAGLAAFDAPVSLANTSIACAAFALNEEFAVETPPLFEDLGGNTCGCPEADGACKVVSSGLAPPQASGID